MRIQVSVVLLKLLVCFMYSRVSAGQVAITIRQHAVLAEGNRQGETVCVFTKPKLIDALVSLANPDDAGIARGKDLVKKMEAKLGDDFSPDFHDTWHTVFNLHKASRTLLQMAYCLLIS